MADADAERQNGRTAEQTSRLVTDGRNPTSLGVRLFGLSASASASVVRHRSLVPFLHPVEATASVTSDEEHGMAARKSSGHKRARRGTGRRHYSRGAQETVHQAMRRKKRGTLRRSKGGRGGRVTSRKQAIAIGLSEAREKGEKVPPRKRSSGRKRSSSKRSSSKRSSSKRSRSKRGSSRSRASSRPRKSSGSRRSSRRSSRR